MTLPELEDCLHRRSPRVTYTYPLTCLRVTVTLTQLSTLGSERHWLEYYDTLTLTANHRCRSKRGNSNTSIIAVWLGDEQERTAHIELHANLAVKLERNGPLRGF